MRIPEPWQKGENVPPCTADELAISLRWEPTAGRGLRGEVIARNISDHACRLGAKPELQPLGRDGQPLGTRHGITLELRLPRHVILQPGQRASAPVAWSGWSGDPASGRVVVSWEGGSTVVTAEGPAQPGPPAHEPGGTTSGWFTLID